MTKQQSNYIKLIAIITMFIDHMGLILLPQYEVLRIIGRISFPLFAYQIGIGVVHTRSVKNYFWRLFGFGVIIQIAYIVAAVFIGEDASLLNIFFTLSLGVIAIVLYREKRYALMLGVLLIPIFLSLVNLQIDYGYYGILLILLMYIWRDNLSYLIVAMIGLTVVYVVTSRQYTQLYSLLAIIFIAKPLSLKLHIPSWFFYVFYPLHMILLYALGMLLVL